MMKPVIHFAHSNGFVSACYRKMLAELEKDYEVKFVAGLGLDVRFPVNNNWSNLVEQVRDSIQSKVQGPVIAVGHSLGAMTSYMCAYKYPELVKGLIMMDPPIVNGPGAFLMATAKALGQADKVTPAGKSNGRREVWATREEAYESLRKKRLFSAFDEDCFNDYIQYGLTDCEEGVRLTMPAEVEVAVFRTTPTNAWAHRGGPLKMPSAVISGEESEFDKGGFIDRLARKHDMLRLRSPGGHMFPLERPIATAQLIKDVIAQLKVD